MAKDEAQGAESPSQLIDARIKELGDWRGEMLLKLRALIKQADPEVVEEWKWRGTPVWYHDGMICTGESYKSVVKVTFAKGASLKDPAGLFNSSLDGNVRRAIDFHEGEKINEAAFKALVRAAITLNASPPVLAERRRPQRLGEPRLWPLSRFDRLPGHVDRRRGHRPVVTFTATRVLHVRLGRHRLRIPRDRLGSS